MLFHCITIADGYGFRLVFNGFKIDRQAQRGTDFIVAAVGFADISGIFQRNAPNPQFKQILFRR